VAAARGRIHVGRRGRVLLFFGCLDLIYAISLSVPDTETRGLAFFVWMVSIAPFWVWASSFAAVGAACVWQAFRRRDQIGFTAAICLKVCWGLISVGGWLFGGVERGYVSAAIWLGLAYLVWNLAGWAEPGDEKGPTWTPPSP
jgi:hypothetical protein